jgi:hypothetical protein
MPLPVTHVRFIASDFAPLMKAGSRFCSGTFSDFCFDPAHDLGVFLDPVANLGVSSVALFRAASSRA